MDGFLVEYVYPFRLINQHFFNVIDFDLVIMNLKAMAMVWTSDHLVH